MIKILFVCHGNICRSPMAEFVLKNMVEEKKMAHEFYIASAATSTEEIGNPVHPGTRNLLKEKHISVAGKHAIRLTLADYDQYDYLLGMDRQNLANMMRILGSDPKEKVQLLLDYTARPRDIADPWYTGDFARTYSDILEGCESFLDFLMNKSTRERTI